MTGQRTNGHQSRNKYSKLVFIALILLSSTLVIQLYQILSRSRIGFGLTDEAYGLSFAVDRAKNGQSGNTPLFSDVTSIFLSLVNFNIYYFRLVGLILISILIAFLVRAFMRIHRLRDSKIWLPDILLLSVTFLTIPANFRYLLITPSYQWIVLTLSIFVVLLILLMVNFEIKNISLFAVLSLSIFCVALARPTSGIMIWLLVLLYTYLNAGTYGRYVFNILNVILVILFSFYILANWFAVKSFAESYAYLRHLDPKGSNLLNEIWDVGISLFFVWSIFFVGHLTFRRALVDERTRTLIRKTVLAFLYIVILASLVLKGLISSADIPHLLLMIYAFLTGGLFALKKGGKTNLGILLLTSAPVLTQFGSNTSASYLVSPLMISLTLFASFSRNVQSSVIIKKGYSLEGVKIGTQILLSISLLCFVVSQSTASYETHLPSKNLMKDSVSGLYYSPKKLENIQEFRRQAKQSGEYTGQRILDLSFWHPGAILYLGGLQYPFGIDNKVFRSTLDLQIDRSVRKIKLQSSKQLPPIIVETSMTVPIAKCLKLSEYIDDSELRNLIILNSFDPNVLNSAVYISDRVDVTLYPRNLAYLVPCKL